MSRRLGLAETGSTDTKQRNKPELIKQLAAQGARDQGSDDGGAMDEDDGEMVRFCVAMCMCTACSGATALRTRFNLVDYALHAPYSR